MNKALKVLNIIKIVLASIYTLALIPSFFGAGIAYFAIIFLVFIGLPFILIADILYLRKISKIRMIASIICKLVLFFIIFAAFFGVVSLEILIYVINPICCLFFIYSALLPILISKKDKINSLLDKININNKLAIIIFTISLVVFFTYYKFAQVLYCFEAGVKTFSIVLRIILAIILLLELLASLVVLIVSSRKEKLLKNIGVTIAFLALTFVIVICSVTGSISFYPNGYKANKLDAYSYATQITIKDKIKTYTGIYLDNNSDIATLYFMGNAMSAYDGFKTLIPYFEEAKTNVLIVDYPMFGGSKGNITQKNLYAEADAFYSYLKNDLGFNTINVAGFSIGTGMANYTTATHEVSKLTLAAPYDNFTNVYNSKLNVFYPPISWTTEYKFTSDKFAKSITCPTTIYCIEDDAMVPCRLAISLSKCYAGEVNLIKLEHGGHVSVVLNEDFIKEVLSIEKKSSVK